MFCPKCGKQNENNWKYCVSCGASLIPKNYLAESTKLVPAVCTQCGAQVSVNILQNIAICNHCGTSFIVSKANKDSEQIRNISVSDYDETETQMSNIIKYFKMQFSEKEKIERERLRRESIYISFGKQHGGKDSDVDEVELADCMAEFIMEFPLPKDKDAFKEFYVYALSHADKQNWGEEIFDIDEIMIKAWKGKVVQIENTIDLRYGQDPDIKKIQVATPKKKKWFR